MRPTAVIVLVWGILLALGFLAGLIIARPWTKWFVGGFVGAFALFTKLADVGNLLLAVPYVLGLGVLGYGAAVLGLRLRAATTRTRAHR